MEFMINNRSVEVDCFNVNEINLGSRVYGAVMRYSLNLEESLELHTEVLNKLKEERCKDESSTHNE